MADPRIPTSLASRAAVLACVGALSAGPAFAAPGPEPEPELRRSDDVTGQRTAAFRLIKEGNELMASLAPMSKESLQTLGNLLARISDTAFSFPEPPAHVLIKAKQDLYERAGRFATLDGVVAHFLLLEGHRDDCYIPTWSAYGVEGHTWEMLDFLSQNDALTFDDLHSKLSRRGVTEEVHAEDVRELARRGWVEESSGVVKATEAGKQVRAEVEAETERLFFLPWSCLNTL